MVKIFYKGNEITENEVTIDLIREILLNYCRRRYEFYYYSDKNNIFDAELVRKEFLDYYHKTKRQKDIDRLDMVIKDIVNYRTRFYTPEYAAYEKETKAKKREFWNNFNYEQELKRQGREFEEAKNENIESEPYQHYKEQLKDKRWFAFRDFIFFIRGYQCEKCGTVRNLQVHHPKYINGRKAWEYTCDEVMVVCKDCHEKIHNINN